jgi:hypothetical protein
VIGILYNAIMDNMEFGQAYCKDLLKKESKKIILFVLNFRNLNLNEFDLTKILKKEKWHCSFWAETGHRLHSQIQYYLFIFNIYNILL